MTREATTEATTAVTSRAEYCVIACAEAWRDNGEVLASPMGLIPSFGARLARRTFSPTSSSPTARPCSSASTGSPRAGCRTAGISRWSPAESGT